MKTEKTRTFIVSTCFFSIVNKKVCCSPFVIEGPAGSSKRICADVLEEFERYSNYSFRDGEGIDKMHKKWHTKAIQNWRL